MTTHETGVRVAQNVAQALRSVFLLSLVGANVRGMRFSYV